MNRIEKLHEMLKEDPKDSFLSFALALEYVNLGNDTTALQYFNGILQNDPGYEGLYYHLGKLHERAGNIEKAIASYNMGMNLTQGKNIKAYNELRSALEELSEDM